MGEIRYGLSFEVTELAMLTRIMFVSDSVMG